MLDEMEEYERLYTEPHTIACDTTLFTETILFHCKGFNKAKDFAHKWVYNHPYGKAKVLSGHIKQEGLLSFEV